MFLRREQFFREKTAKRKKPKKSLFLPILKKSLKQVIMKVDDRNNPTEKRLYESLENLSHPKTNTFYCQTKICFENLNLNFHEHFVA